jgi:hypothetical protein
MGACWGGGEGCNIYCICSKGAEGSEVVCLRGIVATENPSFVLLCKETCSMEDTDADVDDAVIIDGILCNICKGGPRE